VAGFDKIFDKKTEGILSTLVRGF